MTAAQVSNSPIKKLKIGGKEIREQRQAERRSVCTGMFLSYPLNEPGTVRALACSNILDKPCPQQPGTSDWQRQGIYYSLNKLLSYSVNPLHPWRLFLSTNGLQRRGATWSAALFCPFTPTVNTASTIIVNQTMLPIRIQQRLQLLAVHYTSLRTVWYVTITSHCAHQRRALFWG